MLSIKRKDIPEHLLKYFEPKRIFKQKDDLMIPHRVYDALMIDGWYGRQDICWFKPNPMPESVKDRCTKSHEYIFLLSKSAHYYYDNEAIKEPSVQPEDTKSRYKYKFFTGKKHENGGYSPNGQKHTAGYKNLEYDGQQPNTMHLNRLEGNEYMSPVRNKRDVWTVTTKPYKGAHYATFNPDLIKPCILAGAPETCCAKCGAPYERVTEKRDAEYQNPRAFAKKGNADRNDTGEIYKEMVTVTTGFQPTCTCDAGTTRGIVFDPFVGSGTTVATAIQLGRKGIGLDLSMKYLLDNAKERIMGAKMPLFEMEWE